MEKLIKQIREMSMSELKSYAYTLKFLNQGSSRAVYALNKYYVIKIAINKIGYIQNKVEKNAYNKLKYKGMLNPIVTSDARNRWIIAERCKDIADVSDTTLRKIAGTGYNGIRDVLMDCEPVFKTPNEVSENFKAKIINHKLFKSKFGAELKNFFKNKSTITDFSTCNFGYNIKKKEIVMIDYGFDRTVERYY